jgi:hypothetical protein
VQSNLAGASSLTGLLPPSSRLHAPSVSLLLQASPTISVHLPLVYGYLPSYSPPPSPVRFLFNLIQFIPLENNPFLTSTSTPPLRLFWPYQNLVPLFTLLLSSFFLLLHRSSFFLHYRYHSFFFFIIPSDVACRFGFWFCFLCPCRHFSFPRLNI